MQPIHATADNQNQKNSFLRLAKNLKGVGKLLSREYIKKDVHLALRKETVLQAEGRKKS